MIDIIILAIVQALTEFIPVSSSGHLLAMQEVFGLNSSLTIDVALHFGTLIALIIYFAPRLKTLILEPLKNGNKLIIINLVISSIPAAVLGFVLADTIESDTRGLPIVIIMLSIVGLMMIVSDRLFKTTKKTEKIEKLSKSDAWLIGLGQALALLPGTSRSGATMLTVRSLGYSNSVAAEYSFLVGIPIIAGATMKVLLDNHEYVMDEFWPISFGVLVSMTVGYAVLNFLIDYVKRRGLALFGWYRLALALILFIIWLNQ